MTASAHGKRCRITGRGLEAGAGIGPPASATGEKGGWMD
jgi:hypothetical protein